MKLAILTRNSDEGVQVSSQLVFFLPILMMFSKLTDVLCRCLWRCSSCNQCSTIRFLETGQGAGPSAKIPIAFRHGFKLYSRKPCTLDQASSRCLAASFSEMGYSSFGNDDGG